EYLYFPDEGHAFYKLENREKILNKVIQWINKYFFDD
ncbi:MAG: hypothetical protein Faunusvirus67_4, partial [Faunusvirus sp.]